MYLVLGVCGLDGVFSDGLQILGNKNLAPGSVGAEPKAVEST